MDAEARRGLVVALAVAVILVAVWAVVDRVEQARKAARLAEATARYQFRVWEQEMAREDLAPRGELERLRYAVQQVHGSTIWKPVESHASSGFDADLLALGGSPDGSSPGDRRSRIRCEWWPQPGRPWLWLPVCRRTP